MPDQETLDSLLIAAVTEGNAARVRQLLDQEASPDAIDMLRYPDMPGLYRDTPVLYTACQMQRADIVALLLDGGADPNAMLKAYENMLHEEIPSLFMAFPSVTIVELLLQAGADPNTPRWQREDAGWERFAVHEAPREEIKALLRRYGARDRVAPGGLDLSSRGDVRQGRTQGRCGPHHRGGHRPAPGRHQVRRRAFAATDEQHGRGERSFAFSVAFMSAPFMGSSRAASRATERSNSFIGRACRERFIHPSPQC